MDRPHQESPTFVADLQRLWLSYTPLLVSQIRSSRIAGAEHTPRALVNHTCAQTDGSLGRIKFTRQGTNPRYRISTRDSRALSAL